MFANVLFLTDLIFFENMDPKLVVANRCDISGTRFAVNKHNGNYVMFRFTVALEGNRLGVA